MLRALGLDINPGRMIDLVQALAFVEIGRKADFFYTARSLLVHDQDDLTLFGPSPFDLFLAQTPKAKGSNFGEFAGYSSAWRRTSRSR